MQVILHFKGHLSAINYRVRQITFFLLENALKKKKLLNIFSNFFFHLKVQYFRIIMESNFIHMAASAGHAVAHTIGPIFRHIIDCMMSPWSSR